MATRDTEKEWTFTWTVATATILVALELTNVALERSFPIPDIELGGHRAAVATSKSGNADWPQRDAVAAFTAHNRTAPKALRSREK